jgi:hypothetical protein
MIASSPTPDDTPELWRLRPPFFCASRLVISDRARAALVESHGGCVLRGATTSEFGSSCPSLLREAWDRSCRRVHANCRRKGKLRNKSTRINVRLTKTVQGLQPREAKMLCFFNIAGAVYDPDVEGIEMASIDDARIEASRYVGELIRDHPNLPWAGEEVRVEVTDARQLVLFTIIVFGVDAPAGATGSWGSPASPPASLVSP